MSIDTRTSLDTLKRKALSVILQSISINSYSLQNKLNDYINKGGIFNPLLNLFSISSSEFSSAQISGVLLLAYMDFYAAYTIMYANYITFLQLRDISKNKYSYISNLHKDLTNILNAKKYNRFFSFVFYNNFLYPKNIDIKASPINTRSGTSADILNAYPFLSLPIITENIHPPMSMQCYDDDAATHTSYNESSSSAIRYFINRYQSNKTGYPLSYLTIPSTNKNVNVSPAVTGTIFGYYADSIQIIISNVDAMPSGAQIVCSTNDYDFSSSINVIFGQTTSLLIERDIDIGLGIIFPLNADIKLGDSWKLNIKMLDVLPPRLSVKTRFNQLEPISYISYTDLSTYPSVYESAPLLLGTTTQNHLIKAKSFDTPFIAPYIFYGNPESIVIANSPVDDYSVVLTQPNSYIKSFGGKLVHAFDYKISDIKAISRRYAQHGAISFTEMIVADVSSVIIDETHFIPNRSINQKSFIEYNIKLTSNGDSIFLPIMPQERAIRVSNMTVLEYIQPININSGRAVFMPRMPVDTSVKVWNSTVPASGWTYAAASGTFSFDNYSPKCVYLAEYLPKLYSINETFKSDPEAFGPDSNKIWNVSPGGNIYYTYFTDMNGDYKIALRNISNGRLTSFYGTVQGAIEIRSAEPEYISPSVFEYKLLCS
jgi:hypothetical protein